MKVEKEPPLVIITSRSIYPTSTWTDSSLSAASSFLYFIYFSAHAETFGQLFDQQNFLESAHHFSYQAETPNIIWIRLMPSLIYIVNLMYLDYWLSSHGLCKTLMAYLFFPFSYFLLLNSSQVPALNSNLGCTLYSFRQMNTSTSCHNFYTAWYKKQNLYSFLFSSKNLQETFYFIQFNPV